MLFQTEKINLPTLHFHRWQVSALFWPKRGWRLSLSKFLGQKSDLHMGEFVAAQWLITAFLVSSSHSFAYDFALGPSRRLPVPYPPWTWWSLKSSPAPIARTVKEAGVNDVLQQCRARSKCRARSTVDGWEGMAAWQPEWGQVPVQIDPLHLLIRKPLRSCSFSWAPLRLWAPSSGCYIQQPFSSR